MGRIDHIEIIDSQGRHHIPDPELVELAEELMNLFVELRKTYVSGTARIAKKDYVKFYKAARLCRLREQSPGEFVKAQLDGMAVLGKFWPALIASEKISGSIRTYQVSDTHSARRYKSQLICFQRWAKIYGYRETLEDQTVHLTPLFRAVMANKLGFPEIVKRYRDGAIMELKATPVANEAFAGELEFLQ